MTYAGDHAADLNLTQWGIDPSTRVVRRAAGPASGGRTVNMQIGQSTLVAPGDFINGLTPGCGWIVLQSHWTPSTPDAFYREGQSTNLYHWTVGSSATAEGIPGPRG